MEKIATVPKCKAPVNNSRPLKKPDINYISKIAFFFREGKAPAEPHLHKDLISFITAQQELRPPLPLHYPTFSEVSIHILSSSRVAGN
jgi:hypothetical protein